MGLVRMVRPWNEWLIVWGYDINQPEPEVTTKFATKVVRDLVGDQSIQPEITSVSTWTVNNMYATHMQSGRVFIMDSFNLAWKLAAVIKAQAAESLLDSYSEERAPVAKQIVTRANQSIGEFGPIFEALGLTESTDPEVMQANMDKRCDANMEAEQQRAAIREAIAFKKYEFDAHGVEMNQRYKSSAIVTDGQMEPAFELDAELHYQPTTWPGARIPHAWVYDHDGGKHSTLDLVGRGQFTILTGINGEAWVEAAEKVGSALGLDIHAHVIGPRRDIIDHHGDWARAREVNEAGCVLVRPDQHVAWRADDMAENPEVELTRVLSAVLHRAN
ncbi:unnamed protein product [Ectocarpus sp. 12 AP-2014]